MRSRCADGGARAARGSTSRAPPSRAHTRNNAKLPSPRRRRLDDGGSGISGTSGPPGSPQAALQTNVDDYTANPPTQLCSHSTQPPNHPQSPHPLIARPTHIPGESNHPSFARYAVGGDHRIWGPIYPECVARCNRIKCVVPGQSVSIFAGVAPAEALCARPRTTTRVIVHGTGGGDGDSEQIPSIACCCCEHGSGLSSWHSWVQARASAQS